MSRRTQDTARAIGNFKYEALTLSGLPSQVVLLSPLVSHRSPTTPMSELIGLPSCRFARRYSGNRVCFLFLQLLRCFSSLRLPSHILNRYG